MKYWENGFYEALQGGAVEITDEYWRELLEGQSNGLEITTDDLGFPILVSREPTPEELTLVRIAELKKLLSGSDYMAIKVADGAMTAEEYEPVKLQRAKWRIEINELECDSAE